VALSADAGLRTQPAQWTLRCLGALQVLVASAAMTATLPGRTHGLGLITEPLLGDLHLARTDFARMNLAACLLGSLCCLPVGRWIDRRGVREVLVCVALALGLSVWGMASATGPMLLFLTLIGVRGLGQSALSVVSLATIGKWFPQRSGTAMGAFAALLTIGFIAGVLSVGSMVSHSGWRTAWSLLAGMLIFGLMPIGWLLVRTRPDEAIAPVNEAPSLEDAPSLTLRQALRTPAFWILGFGTALFNLVWSGLTLFNESILAERGFDQSAAVELLSILTGCGLIANLVCGGWMSRKTLGVWLAGGLMILAICLAWFPHIASPTTLRIYAALLGFTGGVITVVFFAGWGLLFGRTHLGHIQGAAQATTVVASAIGPEVFAEGQTWTGGYASVFRGLALLAAMAAIAAFGLRLPRGRSEDAP
jgi:MFS family permease